MTEWRELIDTVILLMFENRSFDHMLGHLRLEELSPAVEGLTEPLSQYQNVYMGEVFSPFRKVDGPLDLDLPHEYEAVATQLADSPVSGRFAMTGFVEAYARANNLTPDARPDPMGFFSSSQVPVTSFLAQQYCVCDHWFSSLPTSTQPNRTMAFTGSSEIADTKGRPIPCKHMIFDWLNGAKLRWRVYHDGLTFFALYPRALPHVIGPNFCRYEMFAKDRLVEHDDAAPQVIIVEPFFLDTPHGSGGHANDNHAPLAVAWGEQFLRRVYTDARANPDRWAKTVMIVYYDEHGGFWDHVPPPRISYQVPGGHLFSSLGPRIPGLVISPLVEPGKVFNATLDHTSVLQFLAEVFTPGQAYSEDVERRRQLGVVSLAEAITSRAPRAGTPDAPDVKLSASAALGPGVRKMEEKSEMAVAFELAATTLLKEEPTATAAKYPELYQWKAMVDAGLGDQTS